jgi:hypothetical protein
MIVTSFFDIPEIVTNGWISQWLSMMLQAAKTSQEIDARFSGPARTSGPR